MKKIGPHRTFQNKSDEFPFRSKNTLKIGYNSYQTESSSCVTLLMMSHAYPPKSKMAESSLICDSNISRNNKVTQNR